MRVQHPITETTATVTLTEVVRRGGRTYQPGEQFSVLSITTTTVYALDADGKRVAIPLDAVLDAKDAPAPRPHLSLAELRAAGLLTTASALPAAG